MQIAAIFSAFSRLRPTSVTLAPAFAQITAEATPTGPVPPSITTFDLSRFWLNLSFKCFSVIATIPAAVVNAPLGSANTETSKGGTICFFASSIISIASCVSLPPKKIPVLVSAEVDLENIAS